MIAQAIRSRLETLDAAAAKAQMYNVIRRAARKRLYQHAERYHIVDFDDTLFVEQWHRDRRQTIADFATGKAAEVNAATTRAELLAIFDSISEYL